jgi:hypothetical protein
MTAEEAMAAIAKAFDGRAGVTRSTAPGFGKGQLLTSGKLFAIDRRGELMAKLPAPRVAALIATGQAAPFVSGGGKVMREWVLVSPDAAAQWLALAIEAEAFVSDQEAKKNG